MGKVQVNYEDQHPSVMYFLDRFKTHAIDHMHLEDCRDSQILQAERSCISSEWMLAA